jgi:hypothetical protein
MLKEQAGVWFEGKVGRDKAIYAFFLSGLDHPSWMPGMMARMIQVFVCYYVG